MKSNWKKDALVAGGLLLCALFFFWRLFAPSPVDRAVFGRSDFNLQFYPWLKFVFEEWRQGRIPLWNPTLNGGQPGLADIQLGALYPINLIVWAGLALARQEFTPEVLEAMTVLHVWLAAFFAYLLARRITGHRWGGLIAGLIFGFSGYITTYAVIQLPVLQVSTWLPLILYLLDRAWEYGRVKDYLGVGAAFCMAALAGHPQWFIYTAYSIGFFGLFRTFEWGDGRSVRARWLGLAAALGFGLALAAVQLLPTAELFFYSHRAEELNYAFASAGLPPAHLPGMIVSAGFSDLYVFLGSVAILLAILGVRLEWQRARVWLALGTVALLISFGSDTIVHTFCYVFLPGFSFAREPYRILFVVVLAVAQLAGLGASALLDSWDDFRSMALNRLRWGAGGVLGAAVSAILLLDLGVAAVPEVQLLRLLKALGLLAVASGLFWGVLTLIARRAVSPRLAGGMVFGILMLELFSPTWTAVLQDAPAEGLFPNSALVQAIRQDIGEHFRISSEGLLPGGPNSASAYGLQDILGYTPLRLQSRVDFEAKAGLLETKLWGLFNVRYLLTGRDFGGDGRFALVLREGNVNLYRFGGEEYLPRVYLIHAAMTVSSEDVWLKVAENDPRQLVTLVDPLPAPLAVSEPCEDQLSIPEYRSDSSAVDVASRCDGLLVFSEVFYPGWRAWIDGQPAPIYRANGLFRAVVVPAGAHHVIFRFVPLSFWAGAVVSGLALIGGVFLRVRCGNRRFGGY